MDETFKGFDLEIVGQVGSPDFIKLAASFPGKSFSDFKIIFRAIYMGTKVLEVVHLTPFKEMRWKTFPEEVMNSVFRLLQ